MDYVVAKPSDSDDIVQLLANAFSHSEPPALAMGLSVTEMEQFLRLIVPQIVASPGCAIVTSAMRSLKSTSLWNTRRLFE